MSAPALTMHPAVTGWPLWIRQTTAILRTEKKGYDLGIQHNF